VAVVSHQRCLTVVFVFVCLCNRETMSGPRVKYSKTVDMYAFGVMCSELLTWTRAYHNVTVASVFALRDRVVNHQLRPTIPEHIRNASPTTRIVGTSG